MTNGKARTSSSSVFAGIDACGHGWVVAIAKGRRPMRLNSVAVAKTFAEALDFAAPASTVAVDIPIGLMDRGFRDCDLLARHIMGNLKGRVFKTSPRKAIHALAVPGDKDQGYRLHRALTGEGLPPVAAAFARKVAEVDNWMLAQIRKDSKVQDRVFEVHPELCFRALNGGVPVAASKHGAAGLRVRYGLLRPFFKGQNLPTWVRGFLRGRPLSQVKEDDVVDAVVACVTAATWGPGATIPGPKPPSSFGLRMEMRNPNQFDGGRS